MKFVTLSLAAILLAACSSTVPAEPEKTFNLAGSEWGVEASSDIFIQFQSDGKVIGSGGCNNFDGTYKQDGAALTFGPIRSTKRGCKGEVGQAENSFFTTLRDSQSAEGSHLVLILRGADGTPLLELQRRDWD